jgi:GTP cyclohydrolase II
MQSPSLQFIAQTNLPTSMGNLVVRSYRNTNTGHEPLALISGEISSSDEVPVRIHDACFTSEVLGSLKCDCKQQLQTAIHYIQKHGGVIIYLHQEGRGIGLANKIAAYALQEKGLDTIEANKALQLPNDSRTYEDAFEILNDLAITKVQLITNNPIKIDNLEELGVNIVKRIGLPSTCTIHNRSYLQTKSEKMGHLISLNSSET